MTLYSLTLLTHSWLRWIVLVLGLAVLVRRIGQARASAPWEINRIDRAFVHALDAQVTLGLVLYLWLSPLPRAALADLGVAFWDGILRFYLVEHVFGMGVGLVAAHVAFARARRSRDDADGVRSRAPLVGQIVWAVMTLISVPWPFMAYGRPLFRLFG